MMEHSTDSYLSIVAESHGDYREKASKFLAIALPVSGLEEINAKLTELRKTYHDANHHCYAYRLGHENPIFRMNDDGEPSGSAGKPIYGQILSAKLSDVIVVVIRYFGGTKLGIPGLIHAYRTAAREALNQATIIEKIIRVPYKVIFDYHIINEIMRILKEEGVKIVNQTAHDRCEVEFLVRKSKVHQVESRMMRLKNINIVENS